LNKLAVTVALVGGLNQKGEGRGMSPYLPITSDELAEEAKRSYDAGATIVHIHARDPKTGLSFKAGQSIENVNTFREIVEEIRSKCPILINLTTGGGIGQTADQRLAPVPALKPEMASYTSGSLSFGWYSKSDKKFVYDVVTGTSFQEMLKFAETMFENGVKPECEIYCHSMLNNLRIVEHAFKKPLHLQFVLGMAGQTTPATPRNLMHLVDSAKEMFDSFTWSVCAVGLDQWPMITLGAILGAHNIRTGMEDNLYLERGVLAKSNAEMVAKAIKLAQGVGREIASVKETREILQISGGP
jgi:3-keto-5-aminohexanoate cleavage enzyme